MSSNKKQKLDFKDALKAKGARPASEAAVVEVHGVPTTIIRGDMSESAWSQIKARELPEKAIQRYEETGSLPKVDQAAARQAEKDAQFQEETGSARKPSGKMTTVPDDGAGGPRADASLDDTQRTEHVEPSDMGMAVSARNPAGIIPQLATGATPQDVSKAPTDLAPEDMGVTPADAMAAAHTPDSAEETPPQNPAYPADYEQKPGVRTLEPIKMDASGPPPEEPFKLPSVKEGVTSLAQAQIKALQGAQAIAEQQAKSEQELRQQHAIEFAQAQLHEKERQAAYNAKMDEYERASIDIRNQMLEHAKSSVDPNRYWANKDAGQKAAAVIAGALFGFTGQGMQWLQRLDGLVAQDIQAQAADIANRGNMLQAAAGQNRNLIGELRARGVDGAAAYHSAMGMMKESLANQIEMMKLNTSSQNAQAVMDEKIAQIQADAAKDLEKGRQVQEAHALDAQLKMAQIQKLRAEAADAGTPKPKSLSELTISRHDSIKNSLAGLEELKSAFDRLGGGGSAWERAKQVASANVPFIASDEKAFNSQVQLLASEVAKARSATGTTSENDEKKAIEDLFKAGDPVAEKKYKALKRDLERRLAQSEASLAAGGFNTSSTAAQSGMAPLRPPMKPSK